jgi:hypothetical protein
VRVAVVTALLCSPKIGRPGYVALEMNGEGASGEAGQNCRIATGSHVDDTRL